MKGKTAKWAREKLKVIAIDIDGVLCEGEIWDTKDCLTAKPILENIKKVNKLYRYNFIVIYTARRDFLISATIEWLRKNNIMFHCISNNKMPADYYVDDKMMKL